MIITQMHFCTNFWFLIFSFHFTNLFDSWSWYSDDEISVENEWRVWSFLREHIQKRLLDKTTTIEVWTELKILGSHETICLSSYHLYFTPGRWKVFERTFSKTFLQLCMCHQTANWRETDTAINSHSYWEISWFSSKASLTTTK
jgi:hypothetical protein